MDVKKCKEKGQSLAEQSYESYLRLEHLSTNEKYRKHHTWNLRLRHERRYFINRTEFILDSFPTRVFYLKNKFLLI